jgi:hypothetical protein
MEWSIAIIALALLAVAAVSQRLAGTSLTPTMLFVGIGLLVGPEVLDGIDLTGSSSLVRTAAEATLALVLFSDASRIDLRELRLSVGVPVRLLGIGLPLTIALGALVASVLFDPLTFGEVMILGVILAPTDAALGQAVVSEPRVPARIRQALNVESGLNDGICVPLLFAAVALADAESNISSGRGAVELLLEEIGYGVLGGVAAGALVAFIITQAGSRGLITPQWRQAIPAVGAALARARHHRCTPRRALRVLVRGASGPRRAVAGGSSGRRHAAARCRDRSRVRGEPRSVIGRRHAAREPSPTPRTSSSRSSLSAISIISQSSVRTSSCVSSVIRRSRWRRVFAWTYSACAVAETLPRWRRYSSSVRTSWD